MPKYMIEYIQLCRVCSLDRHTIANMLSIAIPALQREAEQLRSAAGMIAPVFLCWQDLTDDAEILESAIKAGLQRCSPQPGQQELFAA